RGHFLHPGSCRSNLHRWIEAEVIGIMVAGCVFGGVISFATAFIPLTRFSALIREDGGMQIDGQLPFLRHLISDLWRMGWRR
ncbi:hypothetical protein ACFHWV_27620, partial [Micromonospora sp. LOL_028]|uniref:hypothetical protein n=1 Tax=Micromonospora sp. LOL_028 TaxID=3345420 RepID=UPI003A8430B9